MWQSEGTAHGLRYGHTCARQDCCLAENVADCAFIYQNGLVTHFACWAVDAYTAIVVFPASSCVHCRFTVPFTLATSMGLACLALDLPLSADEAANGLVAVAAAQYVIGKVRFRG